MAVDGLHTEEEGSRLMATIKCHISGCDNQATCIGQYEAMDGPEFACDECCGHGCEDGKCWLLEDGMTVDIETKEDELCKITLTF